MIKPDNLRAHLQAAIPELARNPQNLRMAVEKGYVTSTGTVSAEGKVAFLYVYTLNVLLLDFTGADAPFLAIIRWLAVNERELLQSWVNGKQGLPFQVDVLDSGKVDLEIEIPLTERVIAAPGDCGGVNFTHPAEPRLDPGFGPFPDQDVFGWPFKSATANGAAVPPPPPSDND